MLTPVMTKSTQKFTRKDSDEDGVISFEEFQQTRNGSRTDLSEIAEDIVQCVSDLKDETNNENIVVPSVDQFLSLTEKFGNVDTDENGFISIEEMQAKVTTKVNTAFSTMDTDQDSFVSEEEFGANKGTRRATKAAIRQCVDEWSTDDIV